MLGVLIQRLPSVPVATSSPPSLRTDISKPGSGLPIEFGTIRDRTYLRWRYLQHPLFDYSIVQLKRALHLHPRIGAIVRMTDEAVYLMEIGGRFSRS